MEAERAIWVVALGGNLPSRHGNPESTLVCAVQALASKGGVIRAVSRFYASPCFPIGAGPDYVNAAILLESDLSPAALLAVVNAIEADFGRERAGRWGARPLDLDLICANQTILPDRQVLKHWMDLAAKDQRQQTPQQLVLPHPRLQDRAFVLLPMRDIWPDWVHPVTGQTVTTMLHALAPGEIDAVRPL